MKIQVTKGPRAGKILDWPERQAKALIAAKRAKAVRSRLIAAKRAKAVRSSPKRPKAARPGAQPGEGGADSDPAAVLHGAEAVVPARAKRARPKRTGRTGE